jgi:hypothetical protein
VHPWRCGLCDEQVLSNRSLSGNICVQYNVQIGSHRVKSLSVSVHVRIPYFPAHKMHFFPKKCDRNLTCVLCTEGIIFKLMNTHTSIIQHLYRDYDFSGSDVFFGLFDEWWPVCTRCCSCPAERICAQLDKVAHETSTSGAHRPPSFTVHDYNTTISDFQVTDKDKGRSLKMVHKCRNM